MRQGRVIWKKNVFYKGPEAGKECGRVKAGAGKIHGQQFVKAVTSLWVSSHVSMCSTSFQSCPTICDRRDCSSPGSSVHGVLQARTPEWVASPGDLCDPRIEPVSPTSPALQVDSLGLRHQGSPERMVLTLGVEVVQLLSRVCFLQHHGLQPTRLLCPWGFPGKNTGVGSIFFNSKYDKVAHIFSYPTLIGRMIAPQKCTCSQLWGLSVCFRMWQRRTKVADGIKVLSS